MLLLNPKPMKKVFFTLALVLMTGIIFGQNVPRNYVVLEIGTGTWCVWCPGASNGAHDLLVNGCQVAVIKNHNGDAFAYSASNARNSYYGITGYPTAFFDGTTSHVGGAQCPSGTTYGSYLPLYNSAYAVTSPLTIDIAGTNSGNTYNITLSIHKVGTITATDLKVHLVLTESNIPTSPWPPSGQCMNEVDYVSRIMVPDENGTTLSFTSGDFQFINLTFQKDASWVASACELVAFVQSSNAKTIYNCMKVALNSLPLPMTVDFTGTPTTGCAPFTTTFAGSAAGASNWQWSFPGGSPSSSLIQNPSVTYNTSGSYDVTLTAWNATTGRGNVKTKTAYISVTALPVAPGMPQGQPGMCINPPNMVYSTYGSPGATSYTWELIPPTAGVLTPNGLSCSINFEDTYTGTADLKVRAANSCGDSPWSPSLLITVSEQPGQAATPTGPEDLCVNAPNTDYVTAGATPATSYIWYLEPTLAGAIYPNGTTCTIDWVDTYTGDAELKVKAFNGSCEGIWSNSLAITIHPDPTAYIVTGGGAYCAQGGTGSPVGLDDSETGVDYTLYFNGSVTTNVVSGTGSAISFGDQTGAGDYTVSAVNVNAGCDNMMTGTATVTIDPELPYVPEDPIGPDHVWSGATPTSDYSTTGGTYATSYSWELTPVDAGTITGNTTTGTATWDQTYTGTAFVKVQGMNSCGGGTFSQEFQVTVDVGVGIPQLTGNSDIRIYPNPAKTSVIILSDMTGKARIMFYSSTGTKMLETGEMTISSNPAVDISSLPAGLYLVNVITDDMVRSVKLIVE
jgi:PKD repeat protein